MLKIFNPFYRTQVELDAEALAPTVEAAIQANAQALGKLAGLAEIRALLSAPDAAKCTRAVFNQICQLKGWVVSNPEDPAA